MVEPTNPNDTMFALDSNMNLRSSLRFMTGAQVCQERDRLKRQNRQNRALRKRFPKLDDVHPYLLHEIARLQDQYVAQDHDDGLQVAKHCRHRIKLWSGAIHRRHEIRHIPLDPKNRWGMSEWVDCKPCPTTTPTQTPRFQPSPSVSQGFSDSTDDDDEDRPGGEEPAVPGNNVDSEPSSRGSPMDLDDSFSSVYFQMADWAEGGNPADGTSAALADIMDNEDVNAINERASSVDTDISSQPERRLRRNLASPSVSPRSTISSISTISSAKSSSPSPVIAIPTPLVPIPHELQRSDHSANLIPCEVGGHLHPLSWRGGSSEFIRMCEGCGTFL